MLPIIKQINYTNTADLLLVLDDFSIVCLDSSAYHEKLGRYTFIGIDPFQVLRFSNGVAYLNHQSVDYDIFQLLSEQLNRYSTATDDRINIPFQGGLMGYWSYDLLHQLEDIPRPQKKLINIPDLIMAFYDVIIAIDHQEKKSWILSQGFPEQNYASRLRRAKQRCQWLEDKVAKVSCHNNTRQEFFIARDLVQSNFNQQRYVEMIEKIIQHIVDGDIFQANLSQCFSASLPKHIRPLDVYLKLRQINPAPFSAYLQFPNISIASASPERFLKLANQQVETRPIKGTRPRHIDPALDKQLANELVNSSKDRAENTMIVDLMRNDLSKVCCFDSVKVTQLCHLESFETVHHLVSSVTGKLDSQYNVIDLLKACFPGGSITGAPKVRAMEIIYDLEPYNRGIYCGSIGYIGFDGTMDTSIAIRTFTQLKNQLFFQAGGGIVSDSNPYDEYKESLLKAKTLLKTLCDMDISYDFVD